MTWKSAETVGHVPAPDRRRRGAPRARGAPGRASPARRAEPRAQCRVGEPPARGRAAGRQLDAIDAARRRGPAGGADARSSGSSPRPGARRPRRRWPSSPSASRSTARRSSGRSSASSGWRCHRDEDRSAEQESRPERLRARPRARGCSAVDGSSPMRRRRSSPPTGRCTRRPADAGELAATIAARTSSRRHRVICPPFVCLAAVRDALAGTTRRRRRCPERPPRAGRRLHRRDRGADAGRARDLGHRRPLRAAARRGETDELIGRKLGRARRRRPPPDPVRRRAARGSRGGTPGERRRAASSTGASPATTPTALRAGGLVIAYEPVWAIGTGPQRQRADAAAMADAIRARWRARLGRQPPTTLPVLYGGSVTSANIGEFLAEPAIDGALVGGASLKPDEMAGIVARAGVTARRLAGLGRVTGRRRPPRRRPRPIVLVVLDGFGIGPDPAADAIAAAPDADLAGAVGATGRTRCSGRPRTPSGCRRARWATRRSATSTSAPGGRSSRTCRGSTRPSPTASFFERPALLDACAAGGATRRAAPPRQPGRTGRRPCQRPPSRRARRARRPAGRARGPDPCAARRARHAAPIGARLRRRPRGPAGRGPPGRSDRIGRRALLGDGPRQPLGPDRARLRRDRPRGGGARPVGRPRAIEAAYARGENDEFVAPTVIDGVDGDGPFDGDADRPRQLPGRPGSPADPRPGRHRVRRLRPGRAGRPPGPDAASWS